MVKKRNPYQCKKTNKMVRNLMEVSRYTHFFKLCWYKPLVVSVDLFFRWYAKRFLHPDVVSAYEYIFIWDEDLGVEHFNAER